MSAHVKRLEAAGWLKRLPPPSDDKRRFGLAITATGRKAMDAVRRRRNDWLACGWPRSIPPRARR